MTTEHSDFEEVEDPELRAALEAAESKANSRAGQLYHKIERFVIRTCRIGAGVVLAFYAYSYASSGSGIGDTPFASLTLNELFGALLKGLAVLAGFGCALWFAFGAGPTPEGIKQQRWLDTSKAIREQRATRARLAKYYAKSKIWGILHDPELGFSPKRRGIATLVWFLVAAAVYGFVALLAWWGQRG